MRVTDDPLDEVLSAGVGVCPAFRCQVIPELLLRFCPLQKEAITTLEEAGFTDQQLYDLHVSIFAPAGRQMISFGCRQYKGTPKPTGDFSHGKPVMGGICPLESDVVDRLIQLTGMEHA